MPLTPQQEQAMYQQQAAGTGSYFRDATPDMSDSERAQWTNQYGVGGTSYDPARQMEAYRAMQPGYTGTKPTYTGNTGNSTGAFMGGINNGNFATASVESPQDQIARYMAANGGGNPRVQGNTKQMYTGQGQQNYGGFRGFNPNGFRKPSYGQGYNGGRMPTRPGWGQNDYDSFEPWQPGGGGDNWGDNNMRTTDYTPEDQARDRMNHSRMQASRGGAGQGYDMDTYRRMRTGGFRPPTQSYNFHNGGRRMYTGGSRNFNENPSMNQYMPYLVR